MEKPTRPYERDASPYGRSAQDLTPRLFEEASEDRHRRKEQYPYE